MSGATNSEHGAAHLDGSSVAGGIHSGCAILEQQAAEADEVRKALAKKTTTNSPLVAAVVGITHGSVATDIGGHSSHDQVLDAFWKGCACQRWETQRRRAGTLTLRVEQKVQLGLVERALAWLVDDICAEH
jgi:hypothetical protein